jgi:hypothetical protein
MGTEIFHRYGKTLSVMPRSPNMNTKNETMPPAISQYAAGRLKKNAVTAAGNVEAGPISIAAHDEIGSPDRNTKIACAARSRCQTPSAIPATTVASNIGFMAVNSLLWLLIRGRWRGAIEEPTNALLPPSFGITFRLHES